MTEHQSKTGIGGGQNMQNQKGIKAYQQTAAKDKVPLDYETLFEQYKKRIYQIAHHMMNRVPRSMPLEFDDLVSYGAIGLLEAAEKFDASRQNQFSTFADYRIRGAMLDAIRSMDENSRYSRDQAKMIQNAKQTLEYQLGRQPEGTEVADYLGMDVDNYYSLEGKVQSVSHVSLDMENDEGGHTFLEILADDASMDAEELMMNDDFRQQVRAAIMNLADRKRDCILLYYARSLNLAEIAEIFDITPSRVSQILNSARKDLKDNLQELATTYGFISENN